MRNGICLLALILVLPFPGPAYGADPFEQVPEDQPPRTSDLDPEYRFQWLDTSKNIYVLQNRKFQKAEKIHLMVGLGPGLSQPFRTNFDFNARLAYYFTEAWGLEFFGSIITNARNSTFDALTNASNAIPVIREIRS